MENKGKILGVIGGLGPLATTHFMELVVKMTKTQQEQDNVDMIVYNFPSIPDRTGYILGYYRKSPLHGLRYVARALEDQGVDLIAMPCMTAHYFLEELNQGSRVPILDAVSETVSHLRSQGITRVGIMASEGTISSGLFSRAMKAAGITPLIPSPVLQEEVNYLIYQNIKAGLPAQMDRLRAVEADLRSQGAQVILLGCTELSLIKRDHPLGPGFLDAMEVLARQAVLGCGKELQDGYQCLISL